MNQLSGRLAEESEYTFEIDEKMSLSEMQPMLIVTAYSSTGQKVGEAIATPRGKGLVVQSVTVDPAHQRKGIATEMYVILEEETGLKIKPSAFRSDQGKALWKGSGKKHFGSASVRRTAGPDFGAHGAAGGRGRGFVGR